MPFSSKCIECDTIRAAISTVHDCHSNGCLCTTYSIDERLVCLHKQYGGAPEPIDYFIKAEKRIQVNYATLQSEIKSQRLVLPDNADEFLVFVKRIHSNLFGFLKLEFAGHFRTMDEPGVYFGSGSNERPVRTPVRIEAGLKETFKVNLSGIGRETPRRTLSRSSAYFLEEFFAIHPFHDGNGRTARLILHSLAARTVKWAFVAFPEHGSACGEYIFALEEAHANMELLYNDGVKKGNPVQRLSEWLDRYIEEIPATLEYHDPFVE